MKKTLSLVLALTLCLSFASLAMAETFGLGVVSSIDSASAAYVEDGDAYDGNAQVDTTICALWLDDEGKIIDVHFDVAQIKVPFSVEGALLTDENTDLRSKMEKGADYGMLKASAIGKEWFEQVQAFEAYCVGKTVEEVLGMPTKALNEAHPTTPDVEELATTCTMDIGAFLEALEKASNDACAR